MRKARMFALLVALCFSLASIASASSVGPRAPKSGGTGSPATSHNIKSPSLTCLYCGNTAFTGQTDGWTINFGYAVSDSFSLSAAGTMTNDGIATWEFPGDIMTGVDWSIGTSPNSANIASGTSATTDYYFFANQYGYDIWVNRFNTGSVALAAGTTYWLTLQNATNNTGNPVYWDQNDGPSAAWESSVGYLAPVCGVTYPGSGTCSEAFDISGSQGAPSTPEPSSLLLFGSGLLGLGGMIRRRLGK